MPDYHGPERRQDITDVAAWVAASQAADRRMRRYVLIAGLTAFFAAAIIGIIVGLASGHYFAENAAQNARQNSIINCNVQQIGTLRGNARAFTQRQILEIADRAFQQFPARFRDAEVARMNTELNQVRDRLGATAPRVLHSFSDLGRLLSIPPPPDCTRLIQ